MKPLNRTIIVRPSPALRQAPAFTLLEVLIALVIVAMIASALSASLAIAFKARKSAMSSLDNIRQARLAMELIGKDIQRTVPPTGILAGAFFSTPSDAGEDLDTLEFFNTSPPGKLTEGAADVQRVWISVVLTSQIASATVDVDTSQTQQGPRIVPDSEANGDDLVLVRRVTRNLMAQVVPEPPYEIIVRHVKSFRVRLYDGAEWLDTWDSTLNENTLPVAVEVTLEISGSSTSGQIEQDGSSKVYSMTRIFPVHCYASAESIAQSQSNQQQQGGR